MSHQKGRLSRGGETPLCVPADELEKGETEMKVRNRKTFLIAVIGGLAVALTLVFGTIWNGRSARNSTEQAVRSVSLFYLDELAARREQVVARNLRERIDDLQMGLEMMTEEDLSDKEHMEAYQARMKRLFSLERFAFVDSRGMIYTSTGYQTDIDLYPFDYRTLEAASISILNPESEDKKVIVALPVRVSFQGEELTVCFMQIDMAEMLNGVSMRSQEEGATFCNIYTRSGVALSNTLLGGLAKGDNLLEVMRSADFEDGYSYDRFHGEFTEGKRGAASFSYGGIRETLSYVPVEETDWMLTYLIRESVIGAEISSISEDILRRSLAQSLLTVLVLLGLFAVIFVQTRKVSRAEAERERTEAENRVRHQEMERRLALQERLLTQEREKTEQGKLIAALAADYRSVYYLDLDTDSGVCYQAHGDLESGLKAGEHFAYLETVTAYAKANVAEQDLEAFLRFVQPESIREGLLEEKMISFRYTVRRHGRDAYEMVRFAGVRRPEDRDDHMVHTVGACFIDVDAETRRAAAQNDALSQALEAAEQASRAKSSFLSNMSHEIRTPMNAIIGLDSIALNDPETPEKTKEYLEKIGASAEHLLNLINDILDMSRIESGRMTLRKEEFSFARMLEAINTMFSGQCAEKGLDYQCRIDGPVDENYIGDNMKLRQVLINILGNAVKFTPEGGQVRMDVKRTAQFEGRSTLQFRIADTGIGISREYLPHIFDAFSQEDTSNTSRYGSSGLGLAITRSIVEMMNGTIEVESEKGKGTVFTVVVTLEDCQDREAAEDDVNPGEMSVLIVDDDPVACEHARLTLEKAGISAEIAESGAKAVEMVRLRHARMEPYHLILVDWKMPEMDGVETTRRIRAIVGDESAIIILTAYKWDDVLEEALRAGVDSFVAKPLFAAAVMEEFRSAVHRKGLAEKHRAVKADLTGRRILLAEDVEINADIMVMVLQMRGIESDLAENGRIAVEKFSEHPAGYYDAILMDVRMPEMDGLEATRIIRGMDREDAKTIPVIALTANAFDEDVQRSMQAGLNAHLSKPVQPETLFETLENLIQPIVSSTTARRL